MARQNVNIIKVEGHFRNCPGERISPLIHRYSDWEGTFQLCEHYDGNGEIEYDTNIPLVIFHSEGDEKWIDIDFMSRYGTVLHCNSVLAKTKGKFFNYWAYDYKIRLRHYRQPVNMKNSFVPKFLSLNGRPDWHRYYVLQRLHDRNLLKDNLVSFLNRYGNFQNQENIDKFLNIYSGEPLFVKDVIKNQKVLVLDRTNEQIHNDDRSHDNFIYENTSISLVTETYADAERRLFVTEKSYKPLANCHFQIWIAQPGIVDFFRSLEFDMFDDLIDNVYDTVVDDTSRFESALNSLEKLLEDIKKFTDRDKVCFQERLSRNQKKYFDMKISKEEIESWL
jgi:hypothetical protein